MTVSGDAIPPHGGTLINRIASPEEAEELRSKAQHCPVIRLDERAQSDLEMIAIGGYSPLTGFMGREDYHSVLETMHLANGLAWSLPITLPVSEEIAAGLKEGQTVALANAEGKLLGVLELTEKFTYDKTREAQQVYRTTDEQHPGVKVLYEQGSVYLAGPVTLLAAGSASPFSGLPD
jgi:sulfate adenylyltransferase